MWNCWLQHNRTALVHSPNRPQKHCQNVRGLAQWSNRSHADWRSGRLGIRCKKMLFLQLNWLPQNQDGPTVPNTFMPCFCVAIQTCRHLIRGLAHPARGNASRSTGGRLEGSFNALKMTSLPGAHRRRRRGTRTDPDVKRVEKAMMMVQLGELSSMHWREQSWLWSCPLRMHRTNSAHSPSTTMSYSSLLPCLHVRSGTRRAEETTETSNPALISHALHFSFMAFR